MTKTSMTKSQTAPCSSKSESELAVASPSRGRVMEHAGFGRGVILGGLLCLFAAVVAHAENTCRVGNPIVYGVGLCDPDATIYGDRVYLYASHDPDMKDWWVWSSDNLTEWKQEGTLQQKDTFLAKYLAAGKKVGTCWATGGASRNGKYYWYYCSNDEIGVSVSDTPRGPWTDPLGKPLIADREYPTGARDPDVFTDEDGTAYLIWGVHNYYIARLNDDMISLAEKGRHIDVLNTESVDDKPALHKYNGKYYLSWSSYYAVSDTIYGPYSYRGSVIDVARMAPIFQIERKEDKYGRRSWESIRLDRHGDFFQFNGQWYYECNDSTQGEIDGNRCAIMGYAHYRDNGDIAPVRFDTTGVGQYDAFNARTEVEDYFKIKSAEVREIYADGFTVQKITAASQLYYPKVFNLCPNTTMKFYAASKDGGEIEVRQDGPDGKVLGVCKVTPTGGLDSYKAFACTLQNEAGTANLCMTFKGGTGEVMRLDWFCFPASAACLLATGERTPTQGGKRNSRCSATASSESQEHKAMNVFDGHVRTFWCPADNEVLPVSLTADLKNVETLKEVRIDQRHNGHWILTNHYNINYIKRVAISVSEDGKNFERIAEEEWPADPTLKSVKFTPRKAQYVRVEILESHGKRLDKAKDTGRVSIAELQFVTPEPAQR